MSVEHSPNTEKEANTFGNYIKDLRKHHNLKQKQLARLTSVSQSSISDIERGITRPENLKVSTVVGLAKAFDIEVGDFAEEVANIIEPKFSNHNSLLKTTSEVFHAL